MIKIDNPGQKRQKYQVQFFPKGRGLFSSKMLSECLYWLPHGMGRCVKVHFVKLEFYPIIPPPYERCDSGLEIVVLFLIFFLHASRFTSISEYFGISGDKC